jgi:hypothetical protein
MKDEDKFEDKNSAPLDGTVWKSSSSRFFTGYRDSWPAHTFA